MEAAPATEPQAPNARRNRAGVSAAQRRKEAALLKRYAATGSAADREEIVERFMPLARSLAMRYSGGGEPLEDLVQVANLALIKAVDRFDPDRGRPFPAFAAPTIIGELRRHFRDRVPRIHLPRSLQEAVLKVEGAKARLSSDLGRSPTVREIAAETELELDAVLDGLEASDARRIGSLDVPVARDEAESLPKIETVGTPEPGYDRVEADSACRAAGLDERERLVLRLRFGGNLTQTEIGARLGVSQMQISRISRKALRKLLVAVKGSEELPARIG